MMRLRRFDFVARLLTLGATLFGLAVVFTASAALPAGAAEHPPVDLETLEMVPKRGWGVSGQNPQNTQTETLDVLVYDMVQSGDRMFVGGAFLNVQENKDATPISQAYLAAFDVYTGEWIETFRPSFDRAVYAVEVLPNGSILVGGEFEAVNGTTRRGLVAIDSITGNIDTSFAGAVDRPWSSRRATVRDMKVEPATGQIYVAGNFSHLDGAGGSRTQVGKAGRFDNDRGVLDANWKPYVSGGAVWGLDTDPSRGEVALSGFFTSVNGEGNTGHFHVVDDSTGATVGGKTELPRNYPASQPEIWDVVYGDGTVFTIGEQHITQVLDADDHRMLGYHHTGYRNNGFPYSSGFAGGSYQAGERIGNIVFAGCHCTHATNNHYESFTGRRTTRHNVMAYDATTGRHLEQFHADIDSPRDGHWAAASDTAGCLWLGGDYHVGGNDAGTPRWLGGFARLCSPTPPIQLDGLADQASEIDQPVSFQIEATGANGVELRYSATGLPNGLSVDPDTGLITGTPTQATVASVTIRVEAPDGGALPITRTIEWVVMDDTAPTIEAIDRTVVLNSEVLNIQPVADDDEGFAFIWTATGLPGGLTINSETGAISGRPEAGDYQITVTVTDKLGLSASTDFDLVSIAADSVTAIESYSGFSSSNGSYFMGWQFTVDETFEISDLGAHDTNRNGRLDNQGATTAALYDKATQQLLGQVDIPANTEVDNGFAYASLDQPVTVEPGKTYIVAAEVSGEPYAYFGTIGYGDGVNYAGYAYRSGAALGYPSTQGSQGPYYFGGTFRVAEDPTPAITNPGDQVSEIDSNTTLALEGDGADGVTLTWEATGLPSGLSIDADTGVITGSPDTLGSSTVTVEVSDEIGLSSAVTFSWSVFDTDPPVIAAIDDMTVVESDDLVIQVVATDAEDSSLEYSATGLPQGTWIDGDGLITGPAARDGIYSVTVTATDPFGLSASETFTLTVLDWETSDAITSYSGYRQTSGSYFMGWQFTVDAEQVISELGAHDTNRDGQLGNVGTTSVALYEKATRQLLAQIEIPADASAENGFVYAALDNPVTVVPGTVYVVAAEVSGERYAYRGDIFFSDGVNYEGYAYKVGTTLGWPNYQGVSQHYYFGGTFRFRGDRPEIDDGGGDDGGGGGGGGGGGNPDTLVAAGATWRYDDTGNDLGTTWRRFDYDDQAWSTGDAQFGFGDDGEVTEWTRDETVTYYARTSFEFDGVEPSSLTLDLKVDDGAIVYLNGAEILRDNMPDGAVNYRTTAVSPRFGAEEAETRTFTVPADALQQGTNVLAVEVHNIWALSSDIAFDLELRQSADAPEGGGGWLIETGSDWSYTDSAGGEPANWKQGIQGANTGAGEFGFGDGDETTELTQGEDTYYFTRSFTVDDPADYQTLTLGLAADDGAVVYINGVEVQRVRMPDGAISFDTRPTIWAANSDELITDYTIDADALVQGGNVIAVEVHNFWPGNSDLSFELYLFGE